MRGKISAICVAGVVLIAAGCDSGGASVDVKQYLGKTSEEIRELLGDPAPANEMDRFSAAELVYREGESTGLPKQLMELKFDFSKAGYCRSMLGITATGYSSPEALLRAIGLGGYEIEDSRADALGYSYKMPPFSLVQVHRPSSMTQKYSNFTVNDRAAGQGPGASQ